MEKSITILYVDDNRLDRELVRDALINGSNEFKLVEAASRIQFDKQLARGGYDLVLTDFNIMGFDGLQALEAVHAKSPEVPVIIVTGTGSEEVAVEAMKLGAADYVIKTPSHIKHLPLTIHAVLKTVQIEVERKQAEDKIKAALKEKEVLLKELHHRVKNNLQVITSLLNLQSAQIKNVRNREAFISARDRVGSIALVHEILYQSDDYTQVDFGKYLTKLTGLLLRLHKDRGASVTLDLRVSSMMLVMDLAVPCGIVVNELVTNALKHAFPKGQKGKITISLKKKNRTLELIVQDNGVGISHQTEEEASGSLGMNLISILTEDQLNGTLKIEQNGGTIAKIQFPV